MDRPGARGLEERIEAIARLVEPGEWASYGDISTALFGSPRAARVVARAAALSDDFPNAHRILRGDGSVARAAGPGRDRRIARARRALAAEGVSFDSGGRADPEARIAGPELAARGRAVRPPTDRKTPTVD
jgi:alkylated DNA nucleotide flippase Atl1